MKKTTFLILFLTLFLNIAYAQQDCYTSEAHTEKAYGQNYSITIKVCGQSNYRGSLTFISDVYYNDGRRWVKVNHTMGFNGTSTYYQIYVDGESYYFNI